MAEPFNADQLVAFDEEVARIQKEMQSIDEENAALHASIATAQSKINANVLKRKELHAAREVCSRQRESLGVKQRILTLEEAAAKSRSEAEAISTRLASKEKELDDLLAKAKQAVESAASNPS